MSGAMNLNCIVCGAEIEPGQEQCTECKKQEGNVQVLTLKEKQEFHGMTIEQERQGNDDYSYQNQHINQQIYMKQFSLTNIGIFTKIFIGVILLALIFIALPITLFILGIGSLIFYLIRK